MANRAYLYSRDSEGFNNPANWERPSQNGIPYYDSRWNIPYAWFFLFSPSDVKMVDESYKNSQWQETRFFAHKANALHTFAQRKPLLLKVAASPFDTETILDRFTQTIAKRSGNYLFLDPSSVFGGLSESDEENFVHCRRILEQIEARDARPSDIVEVIGGYSSFGYTDRESFQMNAIGATYD